jgi:rod shape-determining protein MreC
MIRRRYRLLLVIAFALIFLVAISRISTGSWPMLAMWPALEVLHTPAQWWETSSQWFKDRQILQAERLDFQKKAQQQAALVQEANSLREENRQLRKILDIVGIRGYRWHAAKVRGRSPETMSQRILIQVYGASTDDVIVSSEGLVGVVDSATEHHATVRTIFDASLAVPVTIPGTTLAALSRGEGDRLAINFVPRQAALKAGEVLYTSGAGGIFPPGIAVAQVTDVKPVPGQLFVSVVAEPVAHWQRDNWLAVASQLPGFSQ